MSIDVPLGSLLSVLTRKQSRMHACLPACLTLAGRDPYLQADSVAAVELHQALPGCAAGRRERKGPLHVHGTLTQAPLDAVRLIQLLNLDT